MFAFDQLNTQRLGTFQQFDFRLDKRVNWRRFTLDLLVRRAERLRAQQSGHPQLRLPAPARQLGFRHHRRAADSARWRERHPAAAHQRRPDCNAHHRLHPGVLSGKRPRLHFRARTDFATAVPQ
ncbi:MAG: hypothetical protein WKG07_44730 [Hymenobacter sp.]